MNIKDRINKALSMQKVQVAPPIGFEGTWRTIDIQPDVFVPQRFTIGVAVQSNGIQGAVTEISFQLLRDFRKFRCVYGSRFDEGDQEALVSYAEELLSQAAFARADLDTIEFSTPNLSLGPARHTSGSNVRDAALRLLNDVAVMLPDPRKPHRQGVSTPEAREMVNQTLKELAGADYSKIVAPDGNVRIVASGKPRILDVNLTPGKRCGSVVSAIFHSGDAAEMNLLRTGGDVAALTKERRLTKPGLFVLVPGPGVVDDKLRQHILEMVDDRSWKLERDGFQVSAFESEEELAKEVYDWALAGL